MVALEGHAFTDLITATPTNLMTCYRHPNNAAAAISAEGWGCWLLASTMHIMPVMLFPAPVCLLEYAIISVCRPMSSLPRNTWTASSCSQRVCPMPPYATAWPVPHACATLHHVRQVHCAGCDCLLSFSPSFVTSENKIDSRSLVPSTSRDIDQ